MGDPAKASGGVDDGKQGVSAGADGQGAAPRRASPIDGNVAPAEAPGSWAENPWGNPWGYLCPRCKRGDELAVSLEIARREIAFGLRVPSEILGAGTAAVEMRAVRASAPGDRGLRLPFVRLHPYLPRSDSRGRGCARAGSPAAANRQRVRRGCPWFLDHPGGVRPGVRRPAMS